MRNMLTVPVAIVVAFLSWGLYGPILHEGQFAMRSEAGPSSLRPFICVGLAYFLIAVVVPIVLLYIQGEKGHWSFGGTIWALAAGAAGAIGALGIIWAFKNRGNPVYVMPLVFGLAPVVNTFVTMWLTHTYQKASTIFFVAVVVVAVGAAGVLFFKPEAKNVTVDKASDGAITVTQTVRHGAKTSEDSWKATSEAELKTNPDLQDAYRLYLRAQGPSWPQFFLVLSAIALTALCWGAYGPVLHKGQAKMAGSRLRPFLCVGLSYFAIAVVVPIVILTGYDEPGQWTLSGTLWSLAGGAAGAVGALGIIVAFNFGGRPIYVMPLVFGGAPVVNTITSVIHDGTFSQIGGTFYGSLLLVIVGATCVLLFAPKPGKTPESDDDGKPEEEKSGKRKPPDEKPLHRDWREEQDERKDRDDSEVESEPDERENRRDAVGTDAREVADWASDGGAKQAPDKEDDDLGENSDRNPGREPETGADR